MEAQMNKPGPNGTPGAGSASPGQCGAAALLSSNPTQMLGTILRALAVSLTLIAAILMGVAKQTVIVDVYDSTSGELLGTMSAPAKSVYSSAFVYFIAANAVAFIHSAVSLAVSVGKRAAAVGNSAVVTSIGDLITVAILFSCNGATAAVLLIAESGNDKANWGKICNTYGSFCSQVTAALVLSMIASVAYLKMIILTVIINFQKRTQ